MTFDELMGCYTKFGEENEQVYQQLLEFARSRNLVPFFGAGISCWAYPGWKTALTKLAKNLSCRAEVDALLKENRYEEAASRIEAEDGGKAAFCATMCRLFSPNTMQKKAGKRPAYMDLFPGIFQGPVITTNFDRCIECVFADNHKAIQDTVMPKDSFQKEKTVKMIHEQKPLLVKMHGDVKDPDHLVFTQEAYDETYGKTGVDFRKPLPRLLRLLLERNPILFVGCGLSADRTCSVIRECAQNGTHFAVMELPKETRNEKDPLKPKWESRRCGLNPEFRKRRDFLVTEQNLNVIWYPNGMHNEALTAFFERLARDLAPEAEPGTKAKPEAKLKPKPEPKPKAPAAVLPDNALGCVEIWVPERNEERNVRKQEAIRESETLYLTAETGHSFLAATGRFRGCVDRLLKRGGCVRIVLNDDTAERPFLTEKQRKYITSKRNLALWGYDDLKERYPDKIFLKTVDFYLPASILLTDRYGFFEPYIQNEEQRQKKGFDTFELMLDKAASESGYNTLLEYFKCLFRRGTDDGTK